MKKLKFIFLVLLFSIPFQSFSQEKRNLLKTSMVFPFGEAFLIAYERTLNAESSLELEVVTGSLFSIRPSYRYYLNEEMEAPSGAFISPYLQFAEENVGAGLTVGFQRLFKSKVALEAFIGPAITTQGVGGWAGINIGVAF